MRHLIALLIVANALAGDLAPLAERLQKGTIDERKSALVEIAADGSVDAARLIMTQAGDPALADAAADALVSMHGTAAIEWLFGTGLSFPDPAVRACAVVALGRSALRLKRPLPDALLACESDASPEVRAALSLVLGESGDPAHVPALVRLSDDTAWEVRLAVVRALGRIPAKEAAAVLFANAHEADLTVRREAIALLGAHPASEPAARIALESTDARDRALAACVLARLGKPPSGGDRLVAETDLVTLAAFAAWHQKSGDVESMLAAIEKRPDAEGRFVMAWRCAPKDEAQSKRAAGIASKEKDARLRDGLRAGILRGGFAAVLPAELAPRPAPATPLPKLLAARIRTPAVHAACDWLARHQEADGRWSCSKHNPWSGGIPFPDFIEEDRYVDAGVTGLAVLVFLGEGCRLDGEYGDVARRGVDFLLACQAPNGKIDSAPSWAPSLMGAPSTGDPNPHPTNASNYNHTIGALALAEAYAMSGEESLREPAQRAIAHLFEVPQGGDLPWGAYLRGEDAAPGSFAIQALVVGKAAGLEVDPAFLDIAREYVSALVDDATGRPRFQHVMPFCLGGYDGTATLLAGRAFLGMPLDDEVASKQFAFMDPHRPNWNGHFAIPKAKPRSPADRWRNEDDILNLWYFRYASIALRARGGDAWERWRKELEAVLLPMQRVDGDDEGSWDPEGAWSRVGGRVYATAFAALALEAPTAYDLTAPK